MKTRKTQIFFFLFLCSLLSSYPQTRQYNISGFVKDAVTGEVLINANLLLYKDSLTAKSKHFRGTTSNIYGYFVFMELQHEKYFLIVRYIGYKPKIIELPEAKSGTLIINIDLSVGEIEKEEVVIVGRKQNTSLISNIDVSPELLSKLPSLSGETDVFKLLQLLPGVKTESELSGGLYVRGGSPDQNLTLVDGLTIYNPSHIGNIASTFNSEAIKEIRLIKGAFPAEYGGRLSSILDVKLRTGTKEKPRGVIGLGLINSFFMLEGPLKNNATYMLSGRGMYYDKLQNGFKQSSTVPRYKFSDVNFKANFPISESNIVSVSSLYSKDNLYSPSALKNLNFSMQWDNVSFGFNWLHINSLSRLLNSGFSIIDYKFKSLILNTNSKDVTDNFFASSHLRDYSLKQNFEYHINDEHTFKIGIDLTLHQYNLIYSTAYDPLLEVDPYAGDQLTSLEGALYIQQESQLTERLKLNGGVRIYYFGEREFFNAEPRLEFSYALTENTFIKSAYTITHQFLHLLVRNDVSLPTDLWYPSTKNILPTVSTQYVFGIDQYFGEKMYLLSLESYYRNMGNLYEYKNSAALNSVKTSVGTQIIKGDGEAYGVEVFFNKKDGQLTGWIGYTLAWTRRQFDDLNNGKIFLPKYDRRHDLSFVLSYLLNDNWSAGATWTISSGARFTMPPGGQYRFTEITPGSGSNIYTDNPKLNNASFPAFHKMDVNITYKSSIFNLPLEVYLNVYNIYNRQNPFAQYVSKEDENNQSVVKLKRLVLFPTIPTIGFNVKF